MAYRLIHTVSSLIVTGTFFLNVEGDLVLPKGFAFLGGLNLKNLRDINKVCTSALDKTFVFLLDLGKWK